MKFNHIAMGIFVFIFAGNIYIYQQNKYYSKEVEDADKACMNELSSAERRYEKQIKELSKRLEDQVNVSDLKKRK
jgi:hypothetical protein